MKKVVNLTAVLAILIIVLTLSLTLSSCSQQDDVIKEFLNEIYNVSDVNEYKNFDISNEEVIKKYDDKYSSLMTKAGLNKLIASAEYLTSQKIAFEKRYTFKVLQVKTIYKSSDENVIEYSFEAIIGCLKENTIEKEPKQITATGIISLKIEDGKWLVDNYKSTNLSLYDSL